MGKRKGLDREASKNQSMIDNSTDSRNAKNGYLETGNPAEIASAARVRTYKHPDKTHM